MFESSSEAPDTTVSTMTTNDSVTDEHLLAEIRGDQLQEDNVALIKQLNVLRAQFEQAVQLSAKSKELYKQIEELKVQLIDEKSKKEDLANRLEISIRAQNEATKQLQDEQQRNSLQRQSDYNSMQKELTKVKKSFQQQIDKLFAENQKLQAQKDQDEIAQKTLVGKIDKAVIHSQHYFNRQISSFDELCDILENEIAPETKTTITTQESPKRDFTQVALEQQLQASDKKARKLKAQLKAAAAKINELCENINQKDKQIDNLNYQHQREINELNSTIAQIKEENELSAADKNHKIQVLESKLQLLKDDSAKLKEEISRQRDEISSQKSEISKIKEEKLTLKVKLESEPQPKQVQTQQKKDNSNCEESFLSEQLNSRIEELTAKVASLTKANDELQHSLDAAEREVMMSKVSKETENNELQALKVAHNQALQEIETIREAMRNRDIQDDKKEEMKRRKEEKKQQAQILQLEDTNKCLEKKIFEIQLEIEKALQGEREAKTELEKIKAEKKVLFEQISKLQYDLQDSRQKLSQNVPLTEEDILPPSSWQIPDGDATLQARIQRIASNNALHAVSKLQQCFKSIINYYTKIIEGINHSAEETNTQNQKIYTYLSDFVTSISIALNDQATNFDEFLQYHEVSTSLVNRVTYLRTQITELTRSKETLQSIIDGIAGTFGITDSNDIFTKLNSIRSQIDQQLSISEKRNKRAKEVKQELSNLQSQYKNDVEKLSSDLSRANQNLEAVSAQNKEYSILAKKLKAENADLRRAVSDLEKKIDTVSKLMKNNEEETKKNNTQIIISMKQDYEQTIEHLTTELQKANATITEADAKIQKQCRVIQTQKQAINEKDSEYAMLKQQTDISHRKVTEISALEKKQLIESYERTIAEMKQQCDKFRADVNVLTQQSNKREKQHKDTKLEVNQLKREISRLEKEIKAKEEESEREKKISESALRSATMNAEAQFTAKLSEHRMKWESEKRRILAYAADELRQFFNASEAIDEHSFRSLIGKVKEELGKLQRSDAAIRRMVGASGRQSTDDAVAQLVLNAN